MSFPILAFIAVFAGCLLSGSVAHAQTPALKFTFEDAPGTTTANSGIQSVSLTMFNAANVATDLHGAAGSGVSGAINGSRALDFSSAPNYGGANAPMADAVSSAALGFGNVTSFTATEWFKEDAFQPPVNGLLGRMFVLGAGTAATDINNANTIGMKWQQPNQWNVSIGTGNPTATAIFPANLPTNTWLFMAIVYDGTNVNIYKGSETATATLISTTSAPGLTENLGSAATLYVGNRNTRQRGFAGWIDEFRFYTNYAGSASFVEDIRQQAVGGAPTVTGMYPDGLMLQQATNKFVFTAISPSGVWGSSTNIASIQMTLNGVDVSAGLVFVTNGTPAEATNISVSYTGLKQDQLITASITVQDAKGLIGTGSVTFDTFSKTNFIWEAEEFDHDNYQYIDNPDYTSSATITSYFGLDSVEAVDTHKGGPNGAAQASDYRAGAADNTRTQTPSVADTQRQKFIDLAVGDPSVVDHIVGFWSSAEWQNYTKTFPAGNYNVYARLSSSPSATLTLAHVTSGQGTGSQTTANLGTFAITGTSFTTYQWIPLRDGVGNLAIVDLSGVNTVRVTTGGGANANFYMLVPANTNLPSISGVYPNGQVLFQSTNKLVFTATSGASTISTNSITLTLNGTNVSSSLVFSGSPTSWNVSYTGLLPNQTYTAVISVTDANGSTVSSTLKLDTWNPVFQVEAEDFDFSSGQYIDDPVPTIGAAGNSYFGRVGTMLIDESINGGVPFTTGASASNYRPSDPIATTLLTAAEAARQQFLDAGAPDYNVGFLGPFFWENFTKNWPTGTFNVYGRFASGANIGNIHMGFDQITGGWGTTAQFIQHIGDFTIPTTAGYSSYLYVPLMDQFGNYANVTVGGTNTFRTTFARSLGTSYPGNFGLNINFYMLVAARTDLPRIDGVYPNNFVPMQSTNKLAFVASSPTYGINTTNIHVTLNGVDVSTNLVFTGSSTSWNVSYPGLLPGTSYTAVITITDANGKTATTTVSFSTSFNPADYTWEAEDFDFDPTQSLVPNGSDLRYIDNPAPTSSAATNSYFDQAGALGIDESSLFGNAHPGTYLYRQYDFVATEVTSDTLRQKYIDAQQQSMDPTIADYDLFYWATNGWVNYTRTFPAGNFYLYARLSAGNGAFNLQCAQVTNGWGTVTQATQYLGTFKGTGASFATWQWVPLVNTNTGQPVVLSLSGTNTLQMTGDYNENANFFELVPVAQSISLTASLSGTNILLSFPTQAGSTYTVYWKNDLLDPTWTQLGAPVLGNGYIMSVLDGRSESHRFYRLTIQ
jgi:hypothetical protein